MNTAHALSQIDDSDFETLVTLYLRYRHPHLAGLIRTGTNESGEPIKCRVDGILYVPGNLHQCVAVAYTVTEQKELRRKWLGGKKGKTYEPGDIKKADHEFDAWRGQVPKPLLTLYLATNGFIKSDTELVKEVVSRGRASGIEVEIIEGSQLVDFLDFDPEGQYLREVFLKISVGRLSESLLRRIAAHSLKQHRLTFSLGAGATHEIMREAHEEVLSALRNYSHKLIGLRGESGSGKSTLLRQVAESVNKADGICLWVPAEEIAAHSSPAALMLKVLRGFHPSLDAHAGDKALDIASGIPGGVLALIDDVNRLPSPSEALETLRLLADQANDAGTRLRFVVPLWPGQLIAPTVAKAREPNGWEIINIPSYSAREQQTLAATFPGTVLTEILSVIDALSGDPFLCGLALPATQDLHLSGKGLVEVIRSTFVETMRKAACDAARIKRVIATPGEFVSAVDDLIELSLRLDDPEPEWAEVRRGLGEGRATLLLVLAETNQLFRMEPLQSGERLRWKHDRLRDAMVGRWLANHTLPEVLSGKPSVHCEEFLTSPGLAEAWGMALLFAPRHVQANAITILAEHQPLALANLLRLRPFEEDHLRNLMIQGLRSSLRGWPPAKSAVLGPSWQVIRRLSTTDADEVLEVTEGLPKNWHVSVARFRNGDVQAGLDLMGDFFPRSRFIQLEQAVEAFARRRNDQRGEVADELLASPNDPDLARRVLTLSGYLGWEELAQVAEAIWGKLNESDRLALLHCIVWALNRCGGESAQAQLGSTLLRVRELSNEEKVEGTSRRGRDRYWQFIQPLEHSFRWPITTASARTWVEVARNYPELRNNIGYMLRNIDHPDTLEAYIRIRAEGEETIFDLIELSDRGETSRADKSERVSHRESVPTNLESRARLWGIIKNELDQEVRKWAFRFWRRSASPEDLERLRSIPEGDPLFDEVLRVRLRLRDRNAAGLLVERLHCDPGPWCMLAHTVFYEPGVADVLLENLDRALADDMHSPQIEGLPHLLPSDGARRLVAEKRELLKEWPRMWPALWGSGVPEALALVRECVAGAAHEDLEHFFLFERGGSIKTREMFDALVPVLDRFPEHERSWLAMLAADSGLSIWAQEHSLKVNLYKGELKYWLTEETAVETLNAAAANVSSGVDAVERTEKFYELKEERRVSFDVRSLLKTWLGPSPESNQIIVAAMLLVNIGRGEDVPWWNKLELAENDPAHEAWANTLYLLRRRRWQTPSEANA